MLTSILTHLNCPLGVRSLQDVALHSLFVCAKTRDEAKTLSYRASKLAKSSFGILFTLSSVSQSNHGGGAVDSGQTDKCLRGTTKVAPCEVRHD